VTIRWQPTATNFDLYFDTDPSGANATLIARNVPGVTGMYRWSPPNLAPDTYYLFARGGGSLIPAGSFAVNTPPTGTILAPSFTSGPDYATTMVGNPWDMSDAADVAVAHNFTGISYTNGIFTGTSTNDDPGLTLNVQTPIDPARFYYATVRMRDRGPQDILRGSVGRLHWSLTPNFPATYSTTWSWIIYEDWRTVTFDLRTAQIEPVSRGGPWNNGTKTIFRLDPHEFPQARTIDVDDVKLTGNDRASTTFTIRFTSADMDNDTPALSFFYDTNRAGQDGTRITCAGSGTNPSHVGRNRVYLPVVRSSTSAQTCGWDVSKVPNGDYYIYMVANDGLDTAAVYSETPVEVRH
jgi:hypothetical protein